MTREEALKIAKPILFNTRMVRAIQDGTKTVTRRLIKPQPDSVNDIIYKHSAYDKWFISPDDPDDPEVEVKPPYKVGDILYVRETWCKYEEDHIIDGIRYAYKANSTSESERIRKEFGYKWHPSIHMPKEAARYFLRVTDVRVERVHNITNEQAIHEGIEPHMILSNSAGTITEYRIPGTHDEYPTAWGAFSHLWNSTVKKSELDKYCWTANPWVWVIEFERLDVT